MVVMRMDGVRGEGRNIEDRVLLRPFYSWNFGGGG